MTRKLTLFLVFAFEVALILFVAGWSARANTENLYACGQWVRYNDDIKINEKLRAAFPDRMGKNFILSDDGGNFNIVTQLGHERQIGKIGKHNGLLDIYQTLAPNAFGNHSVFFVSKRNDTIEIMSVHPVAKLEYITTCQK
jgi:hypothetical protein